MGFTQEEVNSVSLKPYFQDLARKLEQSEEQVRDQVKHYYSGYRFSRSNEMPSVYNPFSLMQVFKNKHFSNYWFSSGTPSFLVEKLKQESYEMENLDLGIDFREADLEDNSNLEKLDLVSLLFQSGYLSISKHDSKAKMYHLELPNQEVRESFGGALFQDYFNVPKVELPYLVSQTQNTLKAADLEGFFEILSTAFAWIPYGDYKGSEAFFRSHFYLLLLLSGLECHAEMHTNRGRIDLIVEAGGCLYIIECKFEQTAELALEQIKSRGYFEKYEGLGKQMVLLGVNFSGQTRNVESWQVQKL